MFPADSGAKIATYLTYAFYGLPSECDEAWLAGTLHNTLIERALVANRADCQAKTWPEIDFPTPPEQVFIAPQSINLEVDDGA